MSMTPGGGLTVVLAVGAAVAWAGPPSATARMRVIMGGRWGGPRRWAAVVPSLLASSGGTSAPSVGSVLGWWRRRGKDDAELQRVAADLYVAAAAELRAGAGIPSALLRAADEVPPRLGGPVRRAGAVLLAGGEVDGVLAPRDDPVVARLLRPLAVCLAVTVETGAALATALEQTSAALRAAHRLRVAVRSELAGARATALLLAGLPVVGLGLGAAVGADPLRFLLTTLPGWVCLLLAATLDALGLWWTGALLRTAGDAT